MLPCFYISLSSLLLIKRNEKKKIIQLFHSSKAEEEPITRVWLGANIMLESRG